MLPTTPIPTISGRSRDARPHTCLGRISSKAFTLIEVLIVSAILAILVPIAVPALLESKARAQDASLDARLTLLNQAAERCRIDNSILPDGADAYAAYAHYVSHGYIVVDVDLSGLEYNNPSTPGTWTALQ